MFTNRGASNRANKSHCVVIWSCWDAFNCCAAIWSRYWGAFHGCYIVWNVPFNSNTILLLKGVTRGIHDKGRLWYCYRQLQNGVEPLVIAGTSLNNRRKTMESYLIARTFAYFIFYEDYDIIQNVRNFTGRLRHYRRCPELQVLFLFILGEYGPYQGSKTSKWRWFSSVFPNTQHIFLSRYKSTIL